MCIRPKKMKNRNEPLIVLSGIRLHYVSSYKYLGVTICSNMNDDTEIKRQCRNIYGRGNMIIRNFKHCAEYVKCQLFQSFCTSFYCAPLWTVFSNESVRRIKVAYNRVFRILIGLEHRTSMSEAFICRNLNPFSVVIRKLIVSFKMRLDNSHNCLVATLLNSMFSIHCKLTQCWDKKTQTCSL